MAKAETFNLNATLTNGTATGTVDYNPATGVFSGSNVFLTNGTTTYDFTYVNTYKADTVNFAWIFQDSDGTGNVFFQLDVPMNFTTGDICSTSSNAGCKDTAAPGFYYNSLLEGFDDAGNLTGTLETVTSGTLTPTPEPSSIALLGTGLLGTAGVMRKRFAR